MGSRTAIVDYRQRASEFAVGDSVFLAVDSSDDARGRVLAVYPAIGQIDVEWPAGSRRMPVEDIQKVGEDGGIPPGTSDVPGGPGTVSVSSGPFPAKTAMLRVAGAFVKKSLYWAAKNRHYKATRSELESGQYTCPKCKEGVLQPAPYERLDGSSVKLLGCKNCLFLIRAEHVIGDPGCVWEPEVTTVEGTV